MWTDTHCHIHGEDDPIKVAMEAYRANVGTLICVGTDVTTSHQALGLVQSMDAERQSGATELPKTYATVGLHPHDASNQGMAGIDGIERLLALHQGSIGSQIVAIGECGLDYFYLHSQKGAQQDAFARQIELAKAYDLTLVIHTRDSWDDTFAILKECGLPNRFVFHCFTGDSSIASSALDLGAFISISGMVTFKNADLIRNAAAFVPLDRMVIETDSPFLAPIPHRGKPNVPAYVAVVGEFLAALRGIAKEDFLALTNKAASDCFLLS